MGSVLDFPKYYTALISIFIPFIIHSNVITFVIYIHLFIFVVIMFIFVIIVFSFLVFFWVVVLVVLVVGRIAFATALSLAALTSAVARRVAEAGAGVFRFSFSGLFLFWQRAISLFLSLCVLD